MSPEQWAAWVSAGAACIQAVGAIAAIVYSVRIAHQAEARTLAAERASVAREEAAREASALREEVANARAETRYVDEQHQKDRSAIIVTCNLLDVAIEKCNLQIAKYQEMKPNDYGYNSRHTGKFDPSELVNLYNKGPELGGKVVSEQLATQLLRLPSLVDLFRRIATYNDMPPTLVIKLQNAKSVLEKARADVSAFRENPARMIPAG